MKSSESSVFRAVSVSLTALGIVGLSGVCYAVGHAILSPESAPAATNAPVVVTKVVNSSQPTTPARSATPSVKASPESTAQPKQPQVGNATPGVAPLDTKPAPAQGAQREQHDDCVAHWIVRPGDTLSKISGIVGVSVDRIAYVNNIKDVNMIYDDEALCIPHSAQK